MIFLQIQILKHIMIKYRLNDYIRTHTHTQIFTRNKRYYYSERAMCVDIYIIIYNSKIIKVKLIK